MKRPPLTITVQVQPRSSHDEIVGIHEGRLKIRISAPPVDGKANERLTEVIAKAFGVSKSSVEIVKGHHSRVKTITISGIGRDEYDTLISKFGDA
ncbi:MAG: DUF167 domain-containing protein [Thermodesulfobacteriota bacterium]|jgi:uncharacterized protein (TIGR00251 family)